MNVWSGLGRISRDLELKYSQSNMAILRFNVAINRRVKEGAEKTADFIPCLAFGKNAENIAKWFIKGNLIGLTGHIQTGSYDDKDGKKVYTTEIIVDTFDFCGKQEGNSNGNSNANNQGNSQAFEMQVEDDDLPF